MELTREVARKAQAVFCDIDGTLLDSQSVLREKTIEAVKKLRIPFFLSSGRNEAGVVPYHRALSLSTPFSTLNGASVLSPRGEVLSSTPFSASSTARMMPFLLRHQENVSYSFFDARHWVVSSLSNPYLQKWIGTQRRSRDEVRTSLSSFLAPWNFLLVLGPQEELDQLKEEIRPDTSLTLIHNHPTFLEIYSAQTSKGNSLKEICALYGFDPQSVFAFGDTWIDVPMLKEAGLSGAMGQAPEGVKKEAKFLLPSCDEDGLARFLEEYESLLDR